MVTNICRNIKSGDNYVSPQSSGGNCSTPHGEWSARSFRDKCIWSLLFQGAGKSTFIECLGKILIESKSFGVEKFWSRRVLESKSFGVESFRVEKCVGTFKLHGNGDYVSQRKQIRASSRFCKSSLRF